MLSVVTTGLTAAVTGGVRSPLLVTFVAAYFAAMGSAGDRRPTRLLLGATALGVGTFALLPRAWTGPELASPVHAALTALSILGVGALLAPFQAGLRKKREELARARQEMAADALARGQALEQIGSKVAHELKNPLTGVKALVQLGLRNPGEAASHERPEVVERNVQQLASSELEVALATRSLQSLTGISPEVERWVPNSIGLVLVAGMTIGTAFTLFFVPAIYVLIARDRRAEERGAALGALAASTLGVSLEGPLGAARAGGGDPGGVAA